MSRQRTYRIPTKTSRTRLPNLSAGANGGVRITAAASKSAADAATQRNADEADQTRAAMLLAVYATARGDLDQDTEALVEAGRWLQSLPATVLPLDTVAELLASARSWGQK